MAIRNLDKLFYPRSVAVIGATNRDGLPGCLVMHNLLQGGFDGPILPVSAQDQAVAGVFAYASIGALPITPDLAVVCAPIAAMPGIVNELGLRGTRAAVLMAEENAPSSGKAANDLLPSIYAAARRYDLRIIGPDGIGVIVPGIGLNASITHASAPPGPLAFVSQSSTICTAVLDWAQDRDIGFSYFLSLGETTDIEFGDVIDFLGNDAMTRAIVLYVESIRNGRSFMSAGRGASRNKPVLVIKAGMTEAGQRAAIGDAMLSGADDVYDTAIRRAGMLRVYSFHELFAAVETLARLRPSKAENLGIVANGRGIAALTVDDLVTKGGRLAALSDETNEALKPIMPKGWQPANPISLEGNAPPEQYGIASRALLQDPKVDTVLILHAPSSAVSSSEAAAAVVKAASEFRGQVLTSWMGGTAVAEARHLFGEAAIPTYDTPTQAVDAFVHMMRYRRNQEMLMEAPPSFSSAFTPATQAARMVIENSLLRGETRIAGPEASAILTAYGIPMAETRTARNADDAVAVAQKIGFPVALKILPPDANHRSEIAGVDLFLDSAEGVRAAAESMVTKLRHRRPGAEVRGFAVERMVVRPGAQELMIAVREDPIFGPVIVFGHGGAAAEVIGDRAVALPPLNINLARELISRTRVSQLLHGYGDRPAADIEALCLTLVQVSQMIIDLPEITALEINPLFADAHGVFAIDARIDIDTVAVNADQRLAIRPYPKELEEDFILTSGRRVLLRPIRPEDEPAHYEFLNQVTPEDIRLRFFHLVRQLPHAEMARLTQIDYDREMAFIATAPRRDGSGPETLGVVRIVSDLHNEQAEYAILVRSDQKGQGLGRKLMEKILDYSRAAGIRRITGLILRDNRRMLDLVHDLGFRSRTVPDDDVMEVTIDLNEPPPEATRSAA